MGPGFIIIYQVPSHMALHLHSLNYIVLLLSNLSLTGWKCWDRVNESWTTMWDKVRGYRKENGKEPRSDTVMIWKVIQESYQFFEFFNHKFIMSSILCPFCYNIQSPWLYIYNKKSRIIPRWKYRSFEEESKKV